MSDIRATYVSILTQLRLSRSLHKSPQAGLPRDLRGAAIARLEDAIRAAKQEGDVRADVEPRETAELLVLVGIGLSVWDDLGIRVADPAELMESLLALIEKPRDR